MHDEAYLEEVTKRYLSSEFSKFRSYVLISSLTRALFLAIIWLVIIFSVGFSTMRLLYFLGGAVIYLFLEWNDVAYKILAAKNALEYSRRFW